MSRVNELRRYDMSHSEHRGAHRIEMEEASRGDWVQFEEAKDLIEELESVIDELALEQDEVQP